MYPFFAKLPFPFSRVLFNSLPESARSVEVVTNLGGSVVANSKKIIEVCGSPGEYLSLIIIHSLIQQLIPLIINLQCEIR
jgi:hypothetical protein